jgi:hypothetical protein
MHTSKIGMNQLSEGIHSFRIRFSLVTVKDQKDVHEKDLLAQLPTHMEECYEIRQHLPAADTSVEAPRCGVMKERRDAQITSRGV